MLADIIRDYQSYNSLSGDFDQPRMMTEYAEVLGIHYVYLSQIYNGSRKPGMETFTKLMKAFPAASDDIGKRIAQALKPSAENEREAVAV